MATLCHLLFLLLQFVHSIDPLANTTLTPAEQKLLLGAEVFTEPPSVLGIVTQRPHYICLLTLL